MRLPVRLEAVAHQVMPGRVVADIGTGHALLPAALVSRGISSRVIATELSPGPLVEADRILCEVAGERVQLRRGSGLEPLIPGEASVLVLAGMGGETIRSILAEGIGVAQATERLVLQPQNRPGELRRWLLTHGFALTAEDLVEERGHFYHVVGAVPAGDDGREEIGPGGGTTKTAGGTVVWPVSKVSRLAPSLARFVRDHELPPVPISFLLAIGPLLAAERHPVLGAQLQRRSAGARELIGRLERLGIPGATRRVRAIREELRSLELMEEWLSRSARS